MSTPVDLDAWIATLEQRLLGGMLSDAMAVLREFSKAGLRVGAEGDGVLTPLLVSTIRRLELRWREQQISADDVTLAFATARELIDLWQAGRTPALTHPDDRAGHILVSVAPGDEHTFGAQILADDLRLRGWRVEVMLDSSPEALLRTVAEGRHGAVLLSVGQDGSLEGIGDLIADLRLAARNGGLFVLLGGSGLAEPLAQYHFLGADFVARTAAQGADFLADRLPGRATETRN